MLFSSSASKLQKGALHCLYGSPSPPKWRWPAQKKFLKCCATAIFKSEEYRISSVQVLTTTATFDTKMSGLQGMVKELTAKEAKLSNGDVIPFGVCVWSTGVGPTDFINSLPFAKTAKGRLAVDKYLRVLSKGAESNEGHPEAVSSHPFLSLWILQPDVSPMTSCRGCSVDRHAV